MSSDPGEKMSNARAIVVMGMHRSGTSAVTRLLNLGFGADLPRQLMESRSDNETGFWESQRVADFNDEMLAAAGSVWDDPSPSPEHWLLSEASDPYIPRLAELLLEEFGGSRLFVVKDPRISRLLPFWIRALEAVGAEPHFVIAIRHPFEVAASLTARDGFLLAKSMLLWLWHTLDGEVCTRDHPRSFLTYDELLTDWNRVLDRVGRDLGIDRPELSESDSQQIDGFLTGRHRHHAFSRSDLELEPKLVPWIERTYDAMLTISHSPESSIEALDAVREELRTADLTYGPILADLRLGREGGVQEVHRLGVELRATNDEIAKLHLEAGARGKEIVALHEELEKCSREIADLHEALQKAHERLSRQTADLIDRFEDLETSAARAEMIWASRPWRLYLTLARLLGRSPARGESRSRKTGDSPP